MKIDSPSSEPSMDEILASIRHIISSDAGEENRRPSSPKLEEAKLEDNILDLTNLLPDEKTQVRNSPQRTDSLQNKRQNAPHGEKAKASPSSKEDSLLSSKVVSETTQTLSSLTKLVQDSPSLSPSSPPSVKTGQSIEGLVRELLKPLLKEWLDENLPRLVQWIVTEQIEKIVDQMNTNQKNTSSLEAQKPKRMSPSNYD